MRSLNIIELRDLSFGYKKEKLIINNISMDILKDEITVIRGQNGSGKTTLGKLMMGILRPLKGEVHLLGKNISSMSLAQIGLELGYLFQNPEKHFFANTVGDEMAFILRLKGYSDDIIEDRVRNLLSLFQLEGLKDSPPLLLSQGEKQRLAIASILVNRPQYLILDEPTTGLDIERKRVLLNLLKDLKSKGIGMTIISHDHVLIDELSQRTINIQRGEIAYDKRN